MNRHHESYPLLAIIAAGTISSSPATSSWVDAAHYSELVAELVLGNMASETIDFKIEQATDASGSGAKDLVAATQLAAHASNNDSKVLQISALTTALDSANGFRYVRIRAVTGGATGGPAAATLRGCARYLPGAQTTAVVETKVA